MKKDLSVEINRLQLSLIYDSRVYTTVLMTLSAVLLYILMSEFGRVQMSVWLAYMVLVDSYRIYTANIYAVSVKSGAVDDASAYHHLVVGMVLSGIGWGACSVILYPLIDVYHKMILFGLIIGVSTASTTTLSHKKNIALIYVVLIMMPFLVSIFYAGGEMYILGLMVTLYFIFLIKNISIFYKNSHRLLVLELEAEEREKVVELQKQKALQAYAVKSDFLANMSHELRTPMHAILGFSELGVNKPDTASHDELRSYYPKIQKNGQRLLTLINDLLDLSKLEAGKMDIDKTRIDIVETVKDVVDDLSSLLAEQNLEMKYSITSGDSYAVFDNAKIIQVLFNLISNAVKFSPANGCITVSVCDSKLNSSDEIVDAIQVSISDEGAGVPEDELGLIFDKFVQSGSGVRAGGTGLGLSICREIIELHHGLIDVSNNDDGGAIFSFVIPKG